MDLIEQWAGVLLGLVLLTFLVQGAVREAARGPRSDTAPEEADVAPRPLLPWGIFLFLVLATLGPRLVSLLA